MMANRVTHLKLETVLQKAESSVLITATSNGYGDSAGGRRSPIILLSTEILSAHLQSKMVKRWL